MHILAVARAAEEWQCACHVQHHSLEFANVTAVAKANVYFGGKVVSHTLKLADGSKNAWI